MDSRKVVRQNGFTFPELLVVGALVLICIGVMIALVRPANYAAEHRNALRRLDVATIMKAITAYKTKNGALPVTITDQDTPIATLETGPNLCDELVPQYLSDMPLDPQKGAKVDNAVCSAEFQIYDSGYFVRVEAGHVIVSAPAAEQGENITVERWFSYL